MQNPVIWLKLAITYKHVNQLFVHLIGLCVFVIT